MRFALRSHACPCRRYDPTATVTGADTTLHMHPDLSAATALPTPVPSPGVAFARHFLTKLKLKVAVASVLFRFPVLRQFFLWLDCIPANKAKLVSELRARDGKVCIMSGGIAELFLSSRTQEHVFLAQRRGFVRLAVETRVCLPSWQPLGSRQCNIDGRAAGQWPRVHANADAEARRTGPITSALHQGRAVRATVCCHPLKTQTAVLNTVQKQIQAQMVPIYLFGQTELFDQLATSGGLVMQLSRYFSTSLTYFWGQYVTAREQIVWEMGLIRVQELTCVPLTRELFARKGTTCQSPTTPGLP